MLCLRVLLLTDEAEERDRTSQMLVAADHLVQPAGSCAEAQEALSIQRFDAVLIGEGAPPDSPAQLRSFFEARNGAGNPIPLLALVAEDSPARAGSCDGLVSLARLASELVQAVNNTSKHSRSSSVRHKGAEASRPVFEIEAFRAQVGYDADLLLEIIELFLAEQREQMVEIRECIAVRDLPAVSRVAHTLKGSLSSLHAAQARFHAHELEMASKSEDLEQSRAALAKLEDDLCALIPQLEAVRTSAGATDLKPHKAALLN